jgi:(p)ppGpp synthase/HD superfamily hydrolase
MDIIETSKQVASRAHSGQHRRDGWTPYINHPAAVAGKLARESAVVIATAWLHDVLEDTAETAETLRAAGLPDSVIHAVEVLTKTEGVRYDEYLLGVRQNWIARQVKIADMLHNLSDAPTERQIIKYAKGLLLLLNTQISNSVADKTK